MNELIGLTSNRPASIWESLRLSYQGSTECCVITILLCAIFIGRLEGEVESELGQLTGGETIV